MRLRLLVLVVALMLTSVSCDFDWLTLRFGPDRTGFSPDTSISKDAAQSSMVLNWAAAIGGNVPSAAVANGVVYVGSDKLYAFRAAGTTNCSGSPATCQPLWTAAAGGILSSPAVAGGIVYVSSNDGKLYAFDATGGTNCSGSPATCQPLWTAAGGLAVGSSPAVANGVVYVGSDDGLLYAFDAAGTTNCSGSPKMCQPLWTAPTGGPVHSPPAVANGVVYVGSDDRLLYAFDAAGSTNCSGSPTTCTPLWTATGAGGSPAVANGTVYATGGGALHAFDAAGSTNCSGSPKTCQPLWTTGALDLTQLSAPAVANGLVYIGTDDCSGPTCVSELWAVDAAGTTNCSGSPTTCQPLWKTGIDPASPTGASSPVVSHGAVYVASENLYAFGLEKVAPTTSILIPANGAALSGTAILDASASDNVKVSRVEFRLTGGSYNNALIGAATLTYYGWIYSWDTTTVPNGPYTLNSVAFDAAGNSTRSPNVNIAVGNYPPPTAKLYLTFDDGPDASYTPQILSELKAGGAHATFFVIGQHATQYPSYVQQEHAAGDEIGDHTWDHPFDLTTLTADQIRQELDSTAVEIASLTGNRPSLWRPPGGKYNDTVVQIASSLGLSMRLWNVSSRDTTNPGVPAIISNVVDRVRGGDIVLLHDGGGDRSQTVAALPTIIDTLRQRGYELDPLDATTGTQVTVNEAVVTGE